jgi:hypothetical protein
MEVEEVGAGQSLVFQGKSPLKQASTGLVSEALLCFAQKRTKADAASICRSTIFAEIIVFSSQAMDFSRKWRGTQSH